VIGSFVDVRRVSTVRKICRSSLSFFPECVYIMLGTSCFQNSASICYFSDRTVGIKFIASKYNKVFDLLK
jgi:hypothetical protein